MLEKLNQSLDFLRDKYGFPAGTIARGDSFFYVLKRPGQTDVPLLPHRVERRFVELKKIVDGKTLEDVSTYRFAKYTAGGDILPIIAEQLDLACFLSGSTIARLFASGDGKRVCNIIVRLTDGKSGSIECGTGLPAGADILDRHEIIARRGVACDRAVDTQVPQSSIYLWNQNGRQTYTDTDTELFGLPDEGIHAVRAAYELLRKPELATEWTDAAQRAVRCAQAALDSAATSIPATFGGAQ